MRKKFRNLLLLLAGVSMLTVNTAGSVCASEMPVTGVEGMDVGQSNNVSKPGSEGAGQSNNVSEPSSENAGQNNNVSEPKEDKQDDNKIEADGNAADNTTDKTKTTDTADTTEPAGTTDNAEPSEDALVEPYAATIPLPTVTYKAHVQNIGWQAVASNGNAVGTTGRNLQMEAFVLSMSNTANGTISYQAHVSDIGWQDKVTAGKMAGTTGKNKAIEAIRMELSGALAQQYDIYYRVHTTNFGWLAWVSNGEAAGTQGYAYSVQAIEVRIVAKTDANKPTKSGNAFYKKDGIHLISYQAHVQDIGWMGSTGDGKVAGTTGRCKNLEALKVSLTDEVTKYGDLSGDVICRTHVQDYGWMSKVAGGRVVGTTGKNKHMEAIEISLTGDIAKMYDVYYRVHAAEYGWLGWAKNGEQAGTSSANLSLESIEIRLIAKGSTAAPKQNARSYVGKECIGALTYQTYVQGTGWQNAVSAGRTAGTIGKNKSIQALKMNITTGTGGTSGLFSGGIEYSLYVQNQGWLNWVSANQAASIIGTNKNIEAVKVRLTGELAKYADVYYRTHVSDYGWLGWAKNGQAAGSTKCNYILQALEVQLVVKYASAPGSTSNYYTQSIYRAYQNPGQYYQIQDAITLSGGGYNLSYGYEGVKVMQVIRRLGIGSGIGMGGAFYSTRVQNAVANFQRSVGLAATGNVDLLTWIRLGFNEVQWTQWGAYVSPLKVNRYSNRSAHIEAMISTAYSYLGTAYVIGASGPPGTGIDCSGLVMQSLYAAGLDLSPINPVRHAQPGYEYESRNIWASSKMLHVPYEQRQRGDLIFYQNASGTVIHVAIYLGDDTVIEAWPNQVVVWPIRNGQRSNIKGVARPFV